MSVSSDIAQGLFSKSLHDGGTQDVRVYPHGPVRRSMGELHGEPRDIDSVACGVAFVRGVRPLQEIGDVAQDLVVAEGKVLVQDGQFLIALRKIDQDLRL